MLPLVERDSSSQYCLRKGLFHENIDIMLATELVLLEGEAGKFTVTLRQEPTMVDPERCIGCTKCSEVCPVEVPDEFNAGLTIRKAIYLPVPHNIPNTYVVDMGSCTLCGECEKVCPTNAIDFGREARKQFNILVVDDELVLRNSLKEWLGEEGFRVDTAESGPEALEKLTTHGYHLMLLDIKMPGMDGVEVLKRSKELRPDLVVVMMTAYATVETAVEAMKLGALDYLMKPFDPDILVPLIVQLQKKIQGAGEKVLEVGAVIFSGGFDFYDPRQGKNPYRYGELPNIVTSIEFERILSGTGPTGGKLLRPSDGKDIKKIAWLQCVGSREPQEGCDFCSSICCMFAIKEALLAKEKAQGQIDTTIFYMDMRTFGKDFQRYRERAEKEHGVRFLRSRIHSIDSGDPDGSLRLRYVDHNGMIQEEMFDMVVLSVGQRPPAGTEKLSEIAGVELNEWGFWLPVDLSLVRSSREGVFIGGSFSGARDISESVIQASSASLGASRLIHSKGGGLSIESHPKVPFRDVSRELPRISVFLCVCGKDFSEIVDMEALKSWVEEQSEVAHVEVVDRICTKEGWAQLVEASKGNTSNRILVAACMPYVYNKKLQELGEATGLDPALIEVVDIRTPAFRSEGLTESQLTENLYSIIAIGISKVKGMDPTSVPTAPITRKALVVGGGIAGMTAGLAIADHGYPVTLVEKTEYLGGNLLRLHRTIQGESTSELLEQTIARVEKHPLITVHKNAKIINSFGNVGRFMTTIEKEDGALETIEHGVTVLAIGGVEAKTKSYAYGQVDAVVTQHELEAKLAQGTLDPSNLSTVAMIQCVDSREEPRNYCSRVCCATALKNALYLKQENPDLDVYILYRDLMSYGFLEPYYTKARRAGIVFVQYQVDKKPTVSLEEGKVVLITVDPILGREIIIRPDVLVLSTGIVPGDTREVAELFGVEVGKDGFFQEADYKWRPVDFIKEGIFMAGIAHSPCTIGESIAMAEAAAQRALRILNNERLAAGAIVAEVRHSLCSLCEACISMCPYGARLRDEEEDRVVVDELMCQGCGSCAAVCPNSASVLRGYRDQQVFEVIDAALESVS